MYSSPSTRFSVFASGAAVTPVGVARAVMNALDVRQFSELCGRWLRQGFCHTFGVEDPFWGGPVVSLAGPRSTTGYCLAALAGCGGEASALRAGGGVVASGVQ